MTQLTDKQELLFWLAKIDHFPIDHPLKELLHELLIRDIDNIWHYDKHVLFTELKGIGIPL